MLQLFIQYFSTNLMYFYPPFPQDGWTKVHGDDVTELHWKYYPGAEDHPSAASVVI